MMLGEGAAGEYQQGRGSQRGHEHRSDNVCMACLMNVQHLPYTDGCVQSPAHPWIFCLAVQACRQASKVAKPPSRMLIRLFPPCALPSRPALADSLLLGRTLVTGMGR